MAKFSCATIAIAAALTLPAGANAAYIDAGSSIDLTGFVDGGGVTSISNATSLDFTSILGTPTPGVPGVLFTYGSGTGAFAGVACDNMLGCGLIEDLSSLAVGSANVSGFATLEGGTNLVPIVFSMSSIDLIDRSNPFLGFSASGTLNYGVYDATPATFLFTSQGGNSTSFSATIIAGAVPEPATWAMMVAGIGLVGASMRRQSAKTRLAFASAN